jgi:hypothetical protein
MKKIIFLTFVLVGLIVFDLHFLYLKDENRNLVPLLPQNLINPISPPLPTLPPIPKEKVLQGGIQVFQSFNNCGPASLSMDLSHYGISVSQAELGQEMRPFQNTAGDNDDKSVTLAEVALKAQSYGFITYHRPAGNIDLIKHFIAEDMPVLVRTLLHSNDDIGHFRVIKGYNDNTQEIIQDDSFQGANVSYSYSDFLNIWEPYNYEFLVLVPPDKKEIAENILGELNNENIAWEKSLEISNNTLKNNPDNINAKFNKSVALYYLGDIQGSISVFEEIENNLPSRTLWYQLEPFLAYYKNNDFEKLLDKIDFILENGNRAYSELYYLKGKVYEKENNVNLANENFSLADFYNNSSSWKANISSDIMN